MAKHTGAEAIKAEINKQREAKGQTKIGDYEENVGGGTPAAGGGRGTMHTDGRSGNADSRDFIVADSPEDPKAIAAKEAGKAVRYKQPRNDDGTFAHNSANDKDLHYKSRAKHNPDFLKGIKLTFLEKGDTFVGEDGSRWVVTRDVSEEEFGKMLSSYFGAEGGFHGLASVIIERAPQGRRSKAEKELKESGSPYGYSGKQKSIGENTGRRMDEHNTLNSDLKAILSKHANMNFPKGVMERGSGGATFDEGERGSQWEYNAAGQRLYPKKKNNDVRRVGRTSGESLVPRDLTESGKGKAVYEYLRGLPELNDMSDEDIKEAINRKIVNIDDFEV